MVAAGIPALIVLGGTSALGTCLAALLLVAAGKDNRALHFLFVTQLVVAPTFWAWALYNCIFKNFDLGVVSFAFATVAAAFGFLRLDTRSLELLLNQRRLTGLSGALVVFNYAVGVGVAVKTWTLMLYMIVACASWALTTVIAVKLLSRAMGKASTMEHPPLVGESLP